MKYLFIVVGVLLVSALILFIQVRYYLHVSKTIIKTTLPFTKETNVPTKTLLVLGDSTAYGVGASKPEDSLPGLVSGHIGATYVENYSFSGAKIEDLEQQMQQIKRNQYDVILLQIGANNIVARDKAEDSEKKLEEKLLELTKLSKQTVFLTAGNVGGAPAIPFLFRSYYRNLTLSYHEKFQALGDRIGVTYINLYEKPEDDPFILHPEIYFAQDMFHPSSKGYEVWFSKVKEYIHP